MAKGIKDLVLSTYSILLSEGSYVEKNRCTRMLRTV